MVQRLAIIGFVIAVIVAVFAFVQQQQAVNQVRTAGTAQAVAEAEGGTAVAMAGVASGAQIQAEAERDLALEQAAAAGTTAAEAQGTAAVAMDQVNLASTSQAANAATAGAQVTAAVGTAGAESDARASLEAQTQADLATAKAQVAEAETQEAFYLAAIATATAQVDLANFAAQSAEEDRAQALDDAHAAATQIAQLENDLAAAQIEIEGQPPQPTASSTELPPVPTATPLVETAVPDTTDQTGVVSFTTADGLITFDHPAAWLVVESDQGFIAIVTDEGVLAREQPELQPGQMESSLYFGLGSGILGQEEPATLDEIATTLRGSLTEGSAAVFEYGEIIELTLAGRPAAYMEGTVVNNDTLLIVVDMGNDIFAILLSIVAGGELPDFETDLLAVLESLRLNLE